MEGSHALRVHSITRKSGAGIGFSFPDGKEVGFNSGCFTVLLGSNGSGKTTFLEAILGIRPGYFVEREILGSKFMDLPSDIKRHIGVSTQLHSYSDGVKVRDVVWLHAGAYGVAVNVELLEALKINDAWNSTYAKISGGQKKRLSVYFALAHIPKLAFLDEPEAGLDAQGLEALLRHIDVRTKAGHATIAASHNSHVIDQALGVLFLNTGNIEFSGTKDQFINAFFGECVLEVNLDDMPLAVIDQISNMGQPISYDGISRDRLLIFGTTRALTDIRDLAGLGIAERSMLRKIKSHDLLTWINNKAVTK